MTPLADMIAEMLARGVPHDLIVTAVRAAEMSRNSTGIPVDKTAEKRRAYDRERKAAKKHSTGIPPEIPPERENALYLSSSKEVKEDEVKKERKRGQKIPPEWQPNVGHFAAGKKLGFTPAGVLEQAEDMRLWAHSNDHRAVARKSDWNLTFLSWLRRNKPKGNGHGNGARNDLMAAFDKLIATEDRDGQGDADLLDVTPRRAGSG